MNPSNDATAGRLEAGLQEVSMSSIYGRPVLRGLKFSVTMLLMTAGATVYWDAYFPGQIYWCTDHVGFDYLSPGDWVHGSVETVNTVSAEHSMSGSDLLKAGWSTGDLWRVWFALFAASLFASILLSLLSWRFLRTLFG